MNLRRSAKRFYALHGTKSLGMVAIVVLVFLFIIDGMNQEHDSLDQQVTDTGDELGKMKAKVEAQPRFEDSLTGAEDREDELLPRLFSSPTAPAAAVELQTLVSGAFSSAQAKVVSAKVLLPEPTPAPQQVPDGAKDQAQADKASTRRHRRDKDKPEDEKAKDAEPPPAVPELVRVEVEVAGYTQRIIAGLETLAKSQSKFVRVTEVDLSVNDPVKPGELKGKVVAEGVWLAPRVEKPEEKK